MTDIPGSDRPNGFAAHNAIRQLREATRTLNKFFDVNPEDSEIGYVAALPGSNWYRYDKYVQFLDARMLRDADEDGTAALFGRWTVLMEVRRGDLVYLCVETDADALHFVVYAIDEVRDPTLIEKIKRLRPEVGDVPQQKLQIHEGGPDITDGETSGSELLELAVIPPAKEYDRFDARVLLINGAHLMMHRYFTGESSTAKIHDALDLRWFTRFKAPKYLYMEKENDGVLMWNQLVIRREICKGGLIYLELVHPEDEKESIFALHCEKKRVRKNAIKSAAIDSCY